MILRSLFSNLAIAPLLAQVTGTADMDADRNAPPLPSRLMLRLYRALAAHGVAPGAPFGVPFSALKPPDMPPTICVMYFISPCRVY